MDSTLRFTTRAPEYAAFRPPYPPEIVDAVMAGFTSPSVADLGAGTGISSRLLAAAGATVYAIEPNEAMRTAIEPHARVIAVNARAEATTLPESSVDIVAAFQAYHWFARPDIFAEAKRIARGRARFAAVWNHRDESDGFMRAYDAIIARYGEESQTLDRSRRASGVLDELQTHGWRDGRTLRHRHIMPMTWESLLGYVRSCSYLPVSGPSYEALAGELRLLFERWMQGGVVPFRYVAEAYLAERQ